MESVWDARESRNAWRVRNCELIEHPTLHSPLRPSSTSIPIDPAGPLGQRYELLEWLGRGGMGEVFRARDRLHGGVVALKRVSAPRLTRLEGRDPGGALVLAAEFRTLATLHHPNIVGVLDYGFDGEGHPYFTMELLEGAQTVVDACHGLSNRGRAELLLQMLRAFAYLHRHGVVHRDVKPSNVVVSGGRLRLLDFGIAVHRGVSTLEGPGRISGTLSYMAPEMVDGAPPSPATDLFAAGLIGYQMFSGVHPFGGYSIPAVLKRIAEEDVDMEPVGAWPELRDILARLLARDPKDRYRDAGTAIRDLCRTLGRPGAETPAIRESFLQRAPLVGREAEVELLDRILDELRPVEPAASPSATSPGVVLIEGESGVGKTRLLEEARVRALVKGVQVLRGQAREEAGGPYQIWHEVLRWLCLLAAPTDSEIGVLGTLLPELTAQPERRPGPAMTEPELDPRAGRARLLAVVSALFRRLSRPTLVLLEDLHWCGEESLELLRELQEALRDRPVAFLATCSDDEAPCAVRSVASRVIRLDRLGTADIAELSAAMLGAAGGQAELVAFLESQTEGNVFFLVEVVRALAEEAGELDRVGAMVLPEDVVSGGIRRLVRRRLGRVPADARPLLDLAAVAGRELDLGLLRRLEPAADLEGWLACCVEAGIVEPSQDAWRFRHDKIRAGLLEDLDSERRRQLHAGVARGLAALASAERPRTAALAFHWIAADDLERGRACAERAGLEALAAGAYAEAVSALGQAAELARRLRAPPEQRAFLHRRLGQVHLALGDFALARQCCERAAVLLGAPMPRRLVTRIGGFLLATVRHALHRMWPLGPVRASPSEDPEVARLYDDLIRIYSAQRSTLALRYAALRRLDLARPPPGRPGVTVWASLP